MKDQGLSCTNQYALNICGDIVRTTCYNNLLKKISDIIALKWMTIISLSRLALAASLCCNFAIWDMCHIQVEILVCGNNTISQLHQVVFGIIYCNVAVSNEILPIMGGQHVQKCEVPTKNKLKKLMRITSYMLKHLKNSWLLYSDLTRL